MSELALLEAALPDQPLRVGAVLTGARELGGWSERVADPNDVANAILRAKRKTEDGHTCLLEFVTSAETAFSHRNGAAANGAAT